MYSSVSNILEGKGDSNLVYDVIEQFEKAINSVCKIRVIDNNAKYKGSCTINCWYGGKKNGTERDS